MTDKPGTPAEALEWSGDELLSRLEQGTATLATDVGFIGPYQVQARLGRRDEFPVDVVDLTHDEITSAL